jgi:hypothetical protein
VLCETFPRCQFSLSRTAGGVFGVAAASHGGRFAVVNDVTNAVTIWAAHLSSRDLSAVAAGFGCLSLPDKEANPRERPLTTASAAFLDRFTSRRVFTPAERGTVSAIAIAV